MWGIDRSTVNSPHKGHWRGAMMFLLICAWINGSVNNRKAGDLRRYHVHYDVTVMLRNKNVFTCYIMYQHWVGTGNNILSHGKFGYPTWSAPWLLTHWGHWDQMADISRKTFSSAFNTWMSLKISLKIFPKIRLKPFQHSFRYLLGADQATCRYLNGTKKPGHRQLQRLDGD